MEEKREEEEVLRDNMTLEGGETPSATEEKIEGMADLTDEVSENLTAKEDTIEDKLAKLNDAHLRLMAEYDNYRKRTIKEKSELIRNGGERVLKELLSVVDDLDIALGNIDKAQDLNAVKEGVSLIYGKFVDFLGRQGVKQIETEGATFDDELHEAIAMMPTPDEEQKGKIIDCVKKGYTLHDKVLRHSSVVVGQ